MSASPSTLPTIEPPVRSLPLPIDDMQDTADDRKIWPALAPMMDICTEIVELPFRRADQAALSHQSRHRLLIRSAAVFGTIAVVLAILQLAFADTIGTVNEKVVTAVEILAVSLASIAVGLGLFAAFQTQWLVERNKAERLRLAKFRFLIDPELWSGSPAVRDQKIADLKKQVKQIEGADRDSVHHWLQTDQLPLPPDSVLALTTPPPASAELLDYYLTRRLQFQHAFFQKRAAQNVKLHNITKYPSPVIFFLSVGVVLVHYLYDLSTNPEHLDTISRWMIVLAVSLPVFGGLFRTFRSAYEFARNTYRYRAKEDALSSIKSYVQPPTGPRAEFLGMWASEQILETEHREWIRLMIEAEWFV
jgi:hypothetical protein